MISYIRFMRRALFVAAFTLALPCCARMAHADAAAASALTRKAGKYAVDLRLPQGGLFAEEETDVELHVSDTSQDDPVQGAPPIVKAKVTARVTMPTMASMPAQAPKTHSEGVPGDYGVVLYFPHGGDFQLDLTITPPGDKNFLVSFKLPVGDPQPLKGRKSVPKPYTLEVTTDPRTPEAGKSTELTITIRDRDTREPVTEFDMVHERQIHFMVVSVDMEHFSHEHPVLGADGKFTLQYAFPIGGEYHLFADVAPRGAGSQILMQPVHVSGPASVSTGAAKLATALTDTAGGVRIALAIDPAKLPVGRSVNVPFTLKDAATNAPITDLQPYLGAMAHLMLIHQDGVTFVHSHPDETDPTNGHQGSLIFFARFPRPGAYRGWLQFQRNGKVETATFTWDVHADRRP